MNYNFMNNPTFPGQPVQPQNYQNMPFMSTPAPMISPTTGFVDKPATDSMKSTYGFTIVADEQEQENHALIISPPMLPVEAEKPKRKRSTVKKQSDDIIRADSGTEVVENQPTLETYSQTSMMLEEAIREIDVIAVDLKTEMDAVRLNRNARNRTQAISSLGETIGRLLDSKISAIREINNSITKSNDLDYKRAKDLKNAQQAMDNDDKNIMALYNALIHQQGNTMPNGMMTLPQQMQLQMYSDPNITRSPLVRADSEVGNNQLADQGYLNYLSNITPEQNAMFYENDPNVQTVVVFDHANGHKFFQVMNVATGQVINNVPVPDQRFMDDTYLDLKTMTAKNSNLNITYPIVEINRGITSEY